MRTISVKQIANKPDRHNWLPTHYNLQSMPHKTRQRPLKPLRPTLPQPSRQPCRQPRTQEEPQGHPDQQHP